MKFMRDRAVQMRFVKVDDSAVPTGDELTPISIDPNEIHDLVKDQVRNIGMTVAGVAAAVTVLATAREVIVNNTNPANRR